MKFYEDFILHSHEKLKSSLPLTDLNNFEELDTTDRVFLFSPTYNEDVERDVNKLIETDIDFVLVCNHLNEMIFLNI